MPEHLISCYFPNTATQLHTSKFTDMHLVCFYFFEKICASIKHDEMSFEIRKIQFRIVFFVTVINSVLKLYYTINNSGHFVELCISQMLLALAKAANTRTESVAPSIGICEYELCKSE